jgi:hypothetical protein
MTAARQTDWKTDFGIASKVPPQFFAGPEDLGPTTPQAHLLRRAFGLLKVDGILCAENSPLIYFKRIKQIIPSAVHELQGRFWNHGGAPVLALISDDQVHIYSGMSRPDAVPPTEADLSSLVTILDRVGTKLEEFLIGVESGQFFREHQRYFDPAHRIDRDLLENLKDTREQLDGATANRVPAAVLDALLCRLVFACYLFDREVIGADYLHGLGIKDAAHLRDVLGVRRDDAKAALYRLFGRLADDFNGDLFSDDLASEADLVSDRHIEVLDDFFHGTAVRTGQRAFWPYDFGYIPIETISAIYERFLKTSDDQVGAFYTPRFLAEIVLDTALERMPTLLGKRFLDPACGSGIFLVGLFNRIAEEWRQANPAARNDTKARELMRLLRESLFGVDVNETACRITAFSLYLAYLDQLSPRDIQQLQEKGRALPCLVVSEDQADAATGNIRRADFFSECEPIPRDVALVVGNPPWGSVATRATPAGQWCDAHDRPLPDKQIAAAFVWKAPEHIGDDGRVCLVLPHGVLFNHSTTAIPFQRAWVQTHAIDRVLNLADFQRFLFEKAGHPAVVVRYCKPPPVVGAQRIEYWTPKADWAVTKAEVITIAPQDRSTITVGEVLRDLNGPDAPQIWKQRYWATPRDWRLLDRLSLYPRLRDHVRRAREKDTTKPWIMAVGFQPQGSADDPEKAETISLPSRWFINASNAAIDLLLLTRDCILLDAPEVTVRSGSNKITAVFRCPHVLMGKGATSTAFADFDVSFQDAVRGIHGPQNDRDLLAFLAAYLRTGLAKYFLFHTSSNWGVSRQEVHVEEVLRLPFPLPDDQPDPKRSWNIVREVARLVTDVAKRADADLADRPGIIRSASEAIEPLVEEYFDVLPMEKLLINDTNTVVIPSVRPTRARPLVPTIMPVKSAQLDSYRDRVCEMLNGWARCGRFAVRGHVRSSESLGVGVAIFEKIDRSEASAPTPNTNGDLLKTLNRLSKVASRKHAAIDLVRGVMVFDRNRLYLVKPIGQRYWTQTAAMNDADEIAGTILMRSPQGDL